MKKAVIAAALLALPGYMAGAAAAEGIGKAINDEVSGFYDGEGTDNRTPDQAEGTSLGDAIQGGFYGNAANPRPSGHGTLPSQSPGPSVNNPADPDNPLEGSSWGAYKNRDTTDDDAGGALNAANHGPANDD